VIIQSCCKKWWYNRCKSDADDKDAKMLLIRNVKHQIIYLQQVQKFTRHSFTNKNCKLISYCIQLISYLHSKKYSTFRKIVLYQLLAYNSSRISCNSTLYAKHMKVLKIKTTYRGFCLHIMQYMHMLREIVQSFFCC